MFLYFHKVRMMGTIYSLRGKSLKNKADVDVFLLY